MKQKFKIMKRVHELQEVNLFKCNCYRSFRDKVSVLPVHILFCEGTIPTATRGNTIQTIFRDTTCCQYRVYRDIHIDYHDTAIIQYIIIYTDKDVVIWCISYYKRNLNKIGSAIIETHEDSFYILRKWSKRLVIYR